jgi:hypothetical protein
MAPHQATLAIFGAGQEPAIVKFDADGKAIRAVRQSIRLDPAKGETFAISARGPNKEWIKVHSMTAAAYQRCNQIVGVTFYTPQLIKDDDGHDRPNPHFDRQGEAIRRVKIRKVGIGRNALGNMMAVDYTLSYDLGTYLAQDLLSKWQGHRDSQLGDWAVLGGRTIPDDCKGKPGRWFGVAIPMPDLFLWLNGSRKEVVALIAEHVNRQKFAERNATTICERNILRRFIPSAKLDASLTVTVTGWIAPDRDMVAIGEMAARAEQCGIKLEDGAPVEVVRESDAIADAEEIDGVLAGEADEDMVVGAESEGEPADTDVSPTPPAPATSGNSETAALRSEIRSLGVAVGKEAFDAALQEVECSGLDEIAVAAKPMLVSVRDALKKRLPNGTKKKDGKLFETGKAGY